MLEINFGWDIENPWLNEADKIMVWSESIWSAN
jgi:hypothetical protein